MSEYNQLKGQLAAVNRKKTGNLAVKDLAGLVTSDDVIATENITTLFVVVPKTQKSEWLSGYERLSEYVVSNIYIDVLCPRRATICSLDEDNQHPAHSRPAAAQAYPSAVFVTA